MKRNYVNDYYFDNINSDRKAYLLGFFIADGCIGMNSGCVNSYNFSINISDIDKDLIEFYKKELEIVSKIRTSHNTKGALNRKPTVAIKWTSNYMKEVFENKFNIKSRKTNHLDFKFDFSLIPENYTFSFIRGFFDGDGHISYSEINHQFTFAFYATSKPFLEQIGTIFEKEFNVKFIIEGTIKTKMELFCLRFNSNFKRKDFINKLYNKFYKDSEISLERKKLKFEKYLNTVLNSATKEVESV